MDQKPKCNARDYKTLRGKLRTFFDTSHRKIFDLPPRVMKIKTKLNKQIMIKLKCVCTTKEIIKKMKDNPQIGGK